jgi:CheY-like chemotaxis protein
VLIVSVLINGLTNAMKFCPTGSITVILQAQAEKLLIRIVDTGVGFDESEMSLVFQAFKKLDANSPGAGLGLNITKAMLEKAGGTLTLRSQEGKGTTFEATLPVTWVVPISTEKKAPSIKRRQIRPSDGQCLFDFPTRKRKTSVDVDKAMENLEHYSMSGTTPTKDKTSDTNAINGNSTFEPLRVLIVDDNHICLALLKMSLRKGPIQLDLREANGGSQAVEVFRQFQPDLVLTDVCMPGVDGIAAAEQMREFEEKENLPRSAIYAVTALGDTDLRSKSKGLNGSADLDGWLVKGQDLAHVARDIARRLSSSPNRSPRSSSTPMVASQTA